MRIVVDMNLSPRWIQVLENAGHEAVHWSAVGLPSAPDEEILRWAHQNERVVLSHDLDFGALLAASGAAAPSVIQVRANDVTPSALGPVVVGALRQFADLLADGALIAVEPGRARARILPLQ